MNEAHCGWLLLTDANYGNGFWVRPDSIDAMSIVAEQTYREGTIPDGVFRRTLVYTRGGNCLSVRESPAEIFRLVRTALPLGGVLTRSSLAGAVEIESRVASLSVESPTPEPEP